MKINNVQITNFYPPGEAWWGGVKRDPNKPLIVATISLTLSYDEYLTLLKQNEKHPDPNRT